MGRNTGAVCRMCRREGMKLYLKGDRCSMAKCAIEIGRNPPGMHGAKRSKPSDYAVQFREKQKLARFYCLRDRQLGLFYKKAAKKTGKTGDTLLQLLEMRLDNLVYRFGFAPSRRAARQFVLHKHVLVNGRAVSIPSAVLKAGDIVEVKDNQKSKAYALRFLQANEAKTLSPWLALNKETLRGEILRIPTRDEIAPIVDEQLVVEWYTK